MAMTEKKQHAEARKIFKRKDRNFVAMSRKFTSGSQYIKLCHLESLAKEAEIELPIVYRWLLLLHRTQEDWEA